MNYQPSQPDCLKAEGDWHNRLEQNMKLLVKLGL